MNMMQCDKILQEHTIRFAGLINENGDIIAGKYKTDIKIYLNDSQKKEIYREVVARVSKRERYNSQLGRVRYSASRRENVVIISIPIYDYALLIMAEPDINIDKIAWKILEILERSYSEFFE